MERDLREASQADATGREIAMGKWAQFLFDESVTMGSRSGRGSPRHMLQYVRTSCTCLECVINQVRPSPRSISSSSCSKSREPSLQQTFPLPISPPSIANQIPYTPVSSALANFVHIKKLPDIKFFRQLQCEEKDTLYQIGTLVRLHSRAGAKLSFTTKVKPFFKRLSYTGPFSHEELYREITTIGVNYYQYNKGLKTRRVYIKGKQINVPVKLGLVKLGTKALYLDERESKYILYRQQTLQIFSGQIVLEGNTPES